MLIGNYAAADSRRTRASAISGFLDDADKFDAMAGEPSC